MGALIDTLKFTGILTVVGVLVIAGFWALIIIVPPAENQHIGQERVEWNKAKYSCPNYDWSGYPGSMSVIQEPVNRFGDFKNVFYCPECGAPMEIRDHGLVYVDSNNNFMGKATL